MAELPSHARVAIVGGGIFGVSLLYHLAKEGWTDLVLIEKGELTSGSTWHAAGQCPHFIGSLNMAKIHYYGTQLYPALEKETGQATGWHGCGGIRLALTDVELDWFRYVEGVLKQVGAPVEIIDAEEIRRIHPFLDPFGVKAGARTFTDGHVDPTSVTNAMAIGAKKLGAKIFTRTRATDTKQLPGGEWKIFTESGDVVAQHVVNAAGSYCDQVAQWAGLRAPIVNMVHQYLVTEPLDEVKALDTELPVVRDPYSHSYLRQEQKGLLIGPYETAGAETCFDAGVPWGFDQELLPPELDRLEPFLEKATRRLPLFGRAGIRRVISGAITHTPDGNFLLGPAPGLTNYWMACGASIGICQGGGAGKYLAQQMVHGQAEINMLEFDPRRFGDWAAGSYTREKAVDDYQHMYHCHAPAEQRDAGRPVKKTGLYDTLKARGAQLGETFGWERPRWFSKNGEAEKYSFRRSNWFPAVAEECKAVRERIGLLDLSGFAKFDVTGPDALAFLDRVFANRMPRRDGGVVLAHWLNENGFIEGEATITRLAADRFYLLSAAAAAARDGDMLRQRRKAGEKVEISEVTRERGCLVVAGPRSRDVLRGLTDADLGSNAFRWMSGQEIAVAGVKCRALRVSYVGELGWELHCAMGELKALYDAVRGAGEAHGVADFGLYAMNSLRMEKAYRGWGSELTAELTLLEAGMERFAATTKDYIGKAALDARRAKGALPYRLAYLEVDAGDADVLGNEAVWSNGSLAGVATSGAYGHAVKKSLAFAYVKPELAAVGTTLEIQILGDRRRARVIAEPAYDPGNERLRG